jgi:hypothetical protein
MLSFEEVALLPWWCSTAVAISANFMIGGAQGGEVEALGAGATDKETVVNAMQRIRRRLKERNVESQLRRRLVSCDKG